MLYAKIFTRRKYLYSLLFQFNSTDIIIYTTFIKSIIYIYTI